MQTLYSIQAMNHDTKPGEPEQILEKKLESTQELFTYLVCFLSEVSLYAEKDALKKSQKHLPTASDLHTSTKIAGNEIIREAKENESFQKSASTFKTLLRLDEELIRKCYFTLTKSTAYQDYILTQSRDNKEDKKILDYIFSALMIENEDFLQEVEEKFIHWDDDAEIAIALMHTFLQKPSRVNFFDLTGADKLAFATELLSCVQDKDDYCLEIIKPKLNNWDPERIAMLDMILLKMGVCEMLYFETIPPKVTINEYIDLAKEYSTEQSGHFINGILDNIHKELVSQNKIHKKRFKNSTLE